MAKAVRPVFYGTLDGKRGVVRPVIEWMFEALVKASREPLIKASVVPDLTIGRLSNSSL